MESYLPPDPGPFPADQPRQNAVPFTPLQIEAIRSGVNPGLTMIVGPPGTGKTDVAVQMINLLYHNYPQQRILVVTHSNNALNQIFDKIVQLDVDERHLLRLGHGEEALETTKYAVVCVCVVCLSCCLTHRFAVIGTSAAMVV